HLPPPQEDAVLLGALGSGPRAVAVSPPLRHIGRFPEMRTFLDNLRAEGTVPLIDAVHAYRRTAHNAALVIVISDFLQPVPACEEALGLLGGPLQSVTAL